MNTEQLIKNIKDICVKCDDEAAVLASLINVLSQCFCASIVSRGLDSFAEEVIIEQANLARTQIIDLTIKNVQNINDMAKDNEYVKDLLTQIRSGVH